MPPGKLAVAGSVFDFARRRLDCPGAPDAELAFADQVGRHFARCYGVPPVTGHVMTSTPAACRVGS